MFLFYKKVEDRDGDYAIKEFVDDFIKENFKVVVRPVEYIAHLPVDTITHTEYYKGKDGKALIDEDGNNIVKKKSVEIILQESEELKLFRVMGYNKKIDELTPGNVCYNYKTECNVIKATYTIDEPFYYAELDDLPRIVEHYCKFTNIEIDVLDEKTSPKIYQIIIRD